MFQARLSQRGGFSSLASRTDGVGKSLERSTPEKLNEVRDWLGRVRDFYDLVLQGRNTQEFWKDILAN
jgi:hypothetical protein